MKFSMDRLDNGMTVVTDHLPEARGMAIHWVLRAGSRHEAVDGAAHFLEHLLACSRSGRDGTELIRRLAKISSHFNLVTTAEQIKAHALVLPEAAPEVIERIGSAVTAMPQWDETIFRREKARITTEFHMGLDDGGGQCWQAVQNAAYGDHPVAATILGSLDSIEAMTDAHCLDFAARQFQAQRMALVVSGPVPHEDIMAMAAGAFGTLRPGTSTPQDVPRYRIGSTIAIPKQENLQKVLIALPGWDSGSPSALPAGWMADLLSTELHTVFMEEGAYATPSVSRASFVDGGHLLIDAHVRPDQVDASVRRIREVFNDASAWLTEERIADCALLARTARSFEFLSPYRRADVVAAVYGMREVIATYEDLLAEDDAAASIDRMAAAHRHLTTQGCNVAGYGPVTDLPDARTIFPGPA